MRRALWGIALLASACDLDLFGSYGEYCTEHGGCDGGAAGGSVSAGGGTGGATGGGSGGATGGGSDGGATGGGSAGDGGVTLDVYCERYAQAQCDRASRCLLPQSVNCFESSYSTCNRLERPRARAGVTRYDPAAAEACLQQIANDTCTNAGFSCGRIFLPNGQLGEKCDQDSCVQGYCPEFAIFSSTTCPVCKAFRQLGEDCAGVPGDVRSCGPPNVCIPQTDGGSACVAPLADGTPCPNFEPCVNGCTDYSVLDGGVPRCGPPALGSSCPPNGNCGRTAYCRGGRASPTGPTLNGVCAARLPLGQTCAQEQFDEGCADGGSCIGNTCQLLLGTQPAGAACDLSTQCQRGRCTREQYDSLRDDGGVWIGDGTCLSLVDAGQPCAFNSADCYPGLYCEQDGGCARPVALNAPCPSLASGVCGPNLCQDPLDGGPPRCIGLTPPGMPCGTGWCPAPRACQSFDGGVPLCQYIPVGGMCMGPPRCESYHCPAIAPKVCAASCF